MKKQTYTQKRKRLKGLVKRLNFLLKQRNEETESRIENLVLKIRQLINELSHLFSRRALKRVLGTAALLIGFGLSNQAIAQSFAPPQVNPFGLDTIKGYISAPAFADLDGDGDLDLLVGESYSANDYNTAMQYFENTGSATNPQFGAPIANPFGLDSVYLLAMPAFADLDNDGDIDLLVGEYYGAMKYFENTGSQTDPQFAAPVVNPFGLDSTYYAFPAFADLDGDGDIDLLVGELYGSMKYFENTGSASSPQFAAPQTNPFGLDSTLNAFPAFSDLDGDGDFDLLVGEYYGAMQYFENTGSSTAPQFASPQENPFGLVSTYVFALPAFADLDGDGDIDLLVGEYYGAMQYYENTVVTGISKIDQLDLDIYPNPVKDVLTIDVADPLDRIEVSDITGKTIRVFENPTNQVLLSDLKPGMYLLKITSTDGSFAVKKIQKL